MMLCSPKCIDSISSAPLKHILRSLQVILSLHTHLFTLLFSSPSLLVTPSAFSCHINKMFSRWTRLRKSPKPTQGNQHDLVNVCDELTPDEYHAQE
ncbi:hypothetical protein I7I50_06276 [Histoplasma capsulatum G186AR]|uniref:Uncharacterized protein n=1 Tax=Ajellomyces capsulatus TaxID=5037 RepID=A0A8H7Z125_AJECA|nr:hypothetical protein I7I52_10651 [Histoplasma capsulatum]QSS67258.1 hypothetical protein I7I50_06276 [Histoplasma capsulatum G186AR]